MWCVYLVRIEKSGALYCGITNDLDARIQAHREGRGAKYLRGKGVITLEWSMEAEDRSHASKLEFAIKGLSKKQKEEIIKNSSDFKPK